jgi:hypothetical protein
VQGESSFPNYKLRICGQNYYEGIGTRASHRSTHRVGMDMGLLPNERAHQTTSTVKRLNFFEMILATLYKGK